MIKLVTDKKIIKKVKQGLSETGIAWPTNNFSYNSSLFRKLLTNTKLDSACIDIRNYCLCSSYDEVVKIFNIEKSSFVFTTYRRYKHNVLSYQYNNVLYYFSVSFNKNRGMDFYFYPDLLENCPVDLADGCYPDSPAFTYFEHLIYSFHREMYLKVITYIADNDLLDSTIGYIFKYTNDNSLNVIFEDFKKTKDFNKIMPELK